MSGGQSGRVWHCQRVTRPAGPRTGAPYKCPVCQRTYKHKKHYHDHLHDEHPDLARDEGPDLGDGPQPGDGDLPGGSPAPFYDWGAKPGTADAEFPDLVAMGALPFVINEYDAAMRWIRDVNGPALRLITRFTALEHAPLVDFELVAAAHKERHLAKSIWPNMHILLTFGQLMRFAVAQLPMQTPLGG